MISKKLTSVALSLALLSLVIPSSAQARSAVMKWIDQAHVKAAQTAAGVFGPACKAAPGETLEKLQSQEDQLFATSAQRLSDLDKCDTVRLQKLAQGGYRGPFIQKVIQDISVKLPTLRTLAKDIAKRKSELNELQKENEGYNRQLARFGFLDNSQISARIQLNESMRKKTDELKKPVAAYQTLFGSIWRNQDGAMARYLKSLVRSKISTADYLKEGVEPSPSMIHATIYGNFSFLDKVVQPMIKNERTFISKIKDQYVTTPAGLKFEPSFETKQILAGNLDLLYDPPPTTAQYKQMTCDIDQKYVSGDEDIDLTVTAASFLIGPMGKAVPWVLRLIKLEHLAQSSAAVVRAGQIINALPTGYWSLKTAAGALTACQTNYSRLVKDTKACTPNSSIEDADDFDARELDATNCGLLVLATAMNKQGIGAAGFWGTKLFNGNPQLVDYIQRIQKTSSSAIDLKNNGQNMVGNVSTAKDFAEKVTTSKDGKPASGTGDNSDDDSNTP